MHSSDADAVADARWTSGARPPQPALPPTGAVPPTTMEGFEDASYSLSAREDAGISAVGASVTALHHASVTILQAALPPPSGASASASASAGASAGAPTSASTSASASASADASASASASLPDLDVLDWPLRPWRGLQIDLSSGYFHDLAQLYRAVDLCRMVKASVLVLHTGAETWMGVAMQSVEDMNETWRHANPAGGCYGGCLFYTGSEMRALTAYGLARGVRLVPHCEASPNFPYNINALTTRFSEASILLSLSRSTARGSRSRPHTPPPLTLPPTSAPPALQTQTRRTPTLSTRSTASVRAASTARRARASGARCASF